MFQVTREIRFCYGHRLLDYDGKCRHLHGHNGRAVITLASETLDPLGRPLVATSPDGAGMSLTYDAAGRTTSRQRSGEGTYAFAYDAANRVTSVTAPDGGVTTYGYDVAGQQTTMVDPLGATTQFGYSPLGLPALTPVSDARFSSACFTKCDTMPGFAPCVITAVGPFGCDLRSASASSRSA